MYVTPDPVTPLEDASLPCGAVLLLSFKDPRDNYLWFVLCELPHNSVTPYVCWIYNGTSEGCGEGHYHKHYAEAYGSFSRRKLNSIQHLLPPKYTGEELLLVLDQYPSKRYSRRSPV